MEKCNYAMKDKSFTSTEKRLTSFLCTTNFLGSGVLSATVTELKEAKINSRQERWILLRQRGKQFSHEEESILAFNSC